MLRGLYWPNIQLHESLPRLWRCALQVTQCLPSNEKLLWLHGFRHKTHCSILLNFCCPCPTYLASPAGHVPRIMMNATNPPCLCDCRYPACWVKTWPALARMSHDSILTQWLLILLLPGIRQAINLGQNMLHHRISCLRRHCIDSQNHN